MRVSVRFGTMAALALAFAAPLAPLGAQGRNRPRQDPRAAQPRPQGDGRARGGDRGTARPGEFGQRDNRAQIQAWARPEVRVSGADRARAEERSRDAGRAQRDDRARGENRWGGDDRSRGGDRWRGDDRWRGNDGWRGDARWRDSHVRIVREYFAVPWRVRPVPYRGWLPFGWERRIVLYDYFPLEYDPYCEPVPYELDYVLPPLYRGHRRFLFGDRLVIIDRITRNVLLVIRL